MFGRYASIMSLVQRLFRMRLQRPPLVLGSRNIGTVQAADLLPSFRQLWENGLSSEGSPHHPARIGTSQISISQRPS